VESHAGLWAVDKIILAYFAFASLLLVGWSRNVPDAFALLALHLAAIALVLYQDWRPNPSSWFFRHWYPLIYVAFCYRVMAVLVPRVNPHSADQWLTDLDYAIWKTDPTVWLERIQTPLLTEYLQIVYTLFIPAVLLIAFVLWKNRLYSDFRYYAFLITLGYLVSYVGYVIVPARGPRFWLQGLQHVPLRGLWLFQHMQGGLDRLESIAYDCFPSGHTELTILAWWSARKLTNSLFWPYFAYTLSIIFATVYLRYHYTVDVFAGAAVAVVLLVAAPPLYRNLQGKRGLQDGRS
jgi:membrane-associated phospholipid phosphatase